MARRIKKAFELVYDLQPNTMRKFSPLPNGKEIYWTHLYSVYKICIYWGDYDEELLLGAILHDVLEDTKYTIDTLHKNFGEKVALIVSLCTKKKDYQLFKAGDQDEYFSRIFDYDDKEIRQKALKIKLADRLDNLLGSTFYENISVKEKYLEETKKYYTKIARLLKKEKTLNSAIKYAEESLTNIK